VANAARRPKALSPYGLCRFWRWPALLAWPRSPWISALRSRLGQRQNRRQRTPSLLFSKPLNGQDESALLSLAISSPDNFDMIDSLAYLIGPKIEFVIAPEQEIARILDSVYKIC
jgi:hypothetical protein